MAGTLVVRMNNLIRPGQQTKEAVLSLLRADGKATSSARQIFDPVGAGLIEVRVFGDLLLKTACDAVSKIEGVSECRFIPVPKFFGDVSAITKLAGQNAFVAGQSMEIAFADLDLLGSKGKPAQSLAARWDENNVFEDGNVNKFGHRGTLVFFENKSQHSLTVQSGVSTWPGGTANPAVVLMTDTSGVVVNDWLVASGAGVGKQYLITAEVANVSVTIANPDADQLALGVLKTSKSDNLGVDLTIVDKAFTLANQDLAEYGLVAPLIVPAMFIQVSPVVQFIPPVRNLVAAWMYEHETTFGRVSFIRAHEDPVFGVGEPTTLVTYDEAFAKNLPTL